MPIFKRLQSALDPSELPSPARNTDNGAGSGSPNPSPWSEDSSGSSKTLTQSRSSGRHGSHASNFPAKFGISKQHPHRSDSHSEYPRSLMYGSETRLKRRSSNPSQTHFQPNPNINTGVTDPSSNKLRDSFTNRLGEEQHSMCLHQHPSTSIDQVYPGVVIEPFADDMNTCALLGGSMQLDEMMDGILDRNAATAGLSDRGIQGQVGPTIAPWLIDDALSRPAHVMPSSTDKRLLEGQAATLRVKGTKRASAVLNHSSSVPYLPKDKRLGTADTAGPGASIKSGVDSSSSSINDGRQSRIGSGDSLQSFFHKGRRNSPGDTEPGVPPPQGKKDRTGRFGNTSSSVSGSGSIGEKKKRFLGGLLKRKPNPNLSLNPVANDFTSPDMRESSSSIPSTLSKKSPPLSPSLQKPFSSTIERPDPFNRGWYQSEYVPQDAISPLQEIFETPFRLDMNLDDMEGIIDTSKTHHDQHAKASSTGGTESSSGSLAFQEALHQTSSFATSVSGESVDSTRGIRIKKEGGRHLIGEAKRESMPFLRTNPFQSDSPAGSPTGSHVVKTFSPPSPHSTLPKQHLPPPVASAPRRPSTLRNVKAGPIDGQPDTPSSDASLQPISPTWTHTSQTVFYDPFHSSSIDPQVPRSASLSPSTIAHPSGGDRESNILNQPVASTAAWAAPESWGVETSEAPVEEVISSEEDDWLLDEELESNTSRTSRNSGNLPSPTSPTVSKASITPSSVKKAPPFGFKSQLRKESNTSGTTDTAASAVARKKGKRVGSSSRPGTAVRPGTSGSIAYNPTALHWIRIYRADASYSSYHLPLNSLTADIVSILSNEGGKMAANMKLYVCERGQDRMLLPSEKPLVIQHRRLLQVGYTEADHLDALGKNDLALLCRFIYQTPILPTMDPEEESSYDSFEFIDIAGRDLQTIPIFLHLHSHDIIILNVSRNPMTDIPLDFIQACTNLKELRMSNMALKRIPISIRASTTLARLDVSCNRIADLESVALNEVETLVSLKVQNNKLTSMPSYFAQMKSLKYLNISNNKFESFPSVVCEMSNLVDLDVSFNNITELPAEMSDLKSLEKLGLFSNEISRFPQSFSTLKNLRILDVRRNKLTDLSTVYTLPNLATLQADYNNIVTLDAQLGANVRQFSVPHNSVTRFTLAPQPNMAVVTYLLTNLDLSHGKISTLADEAFSGLINLVNLNLSFNQFTRLPATLDRLVNLEQFSCTDNMLNALPVGFGKLQKLKVINLHNNNLKHLPDDLWSCGSLEIFNASSNLLVALEPPPEAIGIRMGRPGSANSQISTRSKKYAIPPAGLSTRKLLLADNRLSDEIFNWISLMPNIRILNLSFNDIFEVPLYALRKCEKLEALYLSGNKLTSLPSEDLEKLHSLKVLHLNGNKLQTLPSELGAIKTLQHLDVGSNALKYNIANWPYDWNWNWNTSLRYLNLSGNKRLEIKPTSAQDMNHASAFRKELSDFTALSQLRVLGLMDITLRIPSLPDENEKKRVRTSFSDINNMAYGISDMLGTIDDLAMFDLVVPNFRGKENECLFGMFGRATSAVQTGKLAKRLQEVFAETLAAHLQKLEPEEQVSEALRRTFLWSDRKLLEYFSGKVKIDEERRPSWTSFASFDTMFRGWSPGAMNSVLKAGASGAVVYLVDKCLHVGTIGDTLVVLSRKGDAEVLTKCHDPTDREETARIRKAEAWVSTKGFVNDDKDIDISRAFGFWHECPAVSHAAEIRTRNLEESDEFVIIGNHSLWQFCSYQTAVDIARTERNDPMMAAQKLRDFAISYGAEGNVMVMVVNVSDLFQDKEARHRSPLTKASIDVGPDQDGYLAKRQTRRRYDEVGDRTLNRLQQEIEPPTGQIAIVFTDIVNSTHLWETNPAMLTAIKMHHNLMRRQLRLDGGYEVKTEGDSFMVSFQSVTAALLWCFNCQIGLLQQEWPRELLEAHDGKVVYDSNGTIVQRGLRVRMGVHWGAPECEKDPITRRMDYYGPMVNRAARINASADGGQLMASQDVLDEMSSLMEYLNSDDGQVLDELEDDLKREIIELRRIGLEVRYMGDRKLKGLEVPERLHLLYPKSLSGRLEISNEIRPEVEVNDIRKVSGKQRIIDLEQVHQLANIALRLEAVCTCNLKSEFSGEASPSRPARMSIPPSFLAPSIREDMIDEELYTIVESLVGRIENAMSTLYLKNLGEFSSVLAALQSATKIDQNLIVHALALMNGAEKTSV
ncbi:uncharacterized protein L203_105224 [Cryptococcus depauperatus CBS 7841]|uniref:Adenylate cyclase n=1 Tax=Cryptococcus depauperatus CBS 7841 TaxID=1295531 RepID=A0AAJ8JWY1_9TREE